MWARERYYYRHRRVNGQPRRVYIGSGEVGELAAAEDEARRQERAARRAAIHREIETARKVEAPLEDLDRAIEMLARGALINGGYHRHKRQWRKRRGENHRTGEH